MPNWLLVVRYVAIRTQNTVAHRHATAESRGTLVSIRCERNVSLYCSTFGARHFKTRTNCLCGKSQRVAKVF